MALNIEDPEADRLARSLDVWRLRPEGGERGPLLSPARRPSLRAERIELVNRGANQRDLYEATQLVEAHLSAPI